jgi:hypothetical protein
MLPIVRLILLLFLSVQVGHMGATQGAVEPLRPKPGFQANSPGHPIIL